MATERTGSTSLSQGETPKSGGIPYWWVAVGVFFLGWVVMYADRTILSPVMKTLQGNWNLSKAQLGLISSWFFLAYAALQIPSGVMGDKLGRKLVLVPGIILFGLTTAFSGLATSFTLFLVWRVLTGVGEGVYYGPQYALSSEAIPAKFRTIGTAIINSGMAFGTSLGLILSSWLIGRNYSWSSPFYVMAVPTVIVGLLVALFIKERVNGAPAAAKAAQAQPTEKISIGALFKNRNLIAVYVMVFCSLYGFFAVLTWLPFYLQEARGMAGTQVGIISSLIPWASVPGAIFFGYLSDKMGKTKPLVYVLVPLATISLFATVYLQSYPALLCALVLYGLTGKLALDPVLVSYVAKNAPANGYSTAFGVYNFVGMSSSIVAPYLTGWLADTSGSLNSGFYLSGGLLVFGLIVFGLLAKEKQKAAA